MQINGTIEGTGKCMIRDLVTQYSRNSGIVSLATLKLSTSGMDQEDRSVGSLTVGSFVSQDRIPPVSDCWNFPSDFPSIEQLPFGCIASLWF